MSNGEYLLKKNIRLNSQKVSDLTKRTISDIVKGLGQRRYRNPIKMLLEITKLPKSTYYYHLHHRTTYEEKNKVEIELIKKIFIKSNSTYGKKRIKIELQNKYGIIMNLKKITRIMHDNNLKVPKKMGKYKSYRRVLAPMAPNLLKRNFKTDKPLRKLATDITEFRLPWGRAYLQCILDMYNGEILEYEISIPIDYYITDKMVKRLINRYKNKLYGAILHSDQGMQYQNNEYNDLLTSNGIIQSMSDKGQCKDNAVMENFFGRLKTEMFYGYERYFKNFDILKKEVKKYITYYNNERVKTRLKMSPKLYRIINQNIK